MLVSAEGVGPLLVLKTTTGGAQALGLALDGAGWNEIIGTIAGDDAILVITRSERGRAPCRCGCRSSRDSLHENSPARHCARACHEFL